MHLALFGAFLRVGILGYGGGPASIPLIHKEVVENYQWMTEDEFGDILALGNTLPGPIVTKLAGYIGYEKAGVPGAINGVAASSLPTVILMIGLFVALSNFQDQAWVDGVTNGVLPVVTVMMGVLTWNFIKRSKKDFGWKVLMLFITVGIILIEFVNIHPAIVIITLFAAALLQKK
ncbi:chromate transporter [Salibacterium aidingense]|uniref:chromate transporter n=1 Tax=Salibacterium aidingense TaxID=384933 RepID=UPI000402CA3C|nr:chromate transporter [Salibacterium aidingense]